MKQKRILAVDGNWILHRCFTTLRTNRPIEEALPYRFLSMVAKDALAVRANYVLVAFDGPKIFRYKVYPLYKSARNEGKEAGTGDVSNDAKGDVYQYLPNIYDLLMQVGMCFYQPTEYEADDVLCSVAAEYADEYDIVCSTEDKDAYQYLKPGVRLYNSKNKGLDGKPAPIYITHEKLYHGISCDRMLDYQTLIGDRGDSIPTILTPKKAKAVIDAHENLNVWFHQSRDDERIFIRTHMEELRRNRKLVGLVPGILPPNEIEEWKILKALPKIELPGIFHDYHSFVWPRTKGLFG
jgi:5'-3' exonuclease